MSVLGGVPACLSAFSSRFVVIILVLYLINMLPLDGRAKQIVRVIVIIIGIISLLKYHRGVLDSAASQQKKPRRWPGLLLFDWRPTSAC